jgi:hypothetical protein
MYSGLGVAFSGIRYNCMRPVLIFLCSVVCCSHSYNCCLNLTFFYFKWFNLKLQWRKENFLCYELKMMATVLYCVNAVLCSTRSDLFIFHAPFYSCACYFQITTPVDLMCHSVLQVYLTWQETQKSRCIFQNRNSLRKRNL